jgi:glycogen phosphorylase
MRPARPKTSNAGTSTAAQQILDGYHRHLRHTQAKDRASATPYDQFTSLALAVRDCLAERMIETQTTYRTQDVKRACYLSMEFLLGRQLRAHLVNFEVLDALRDALTPHDVNLDQLFEVEPDAGLGNGGLGRLAACYLDSMAGLALPGYGYGLRYEFGIFDQDIVGGWQVERPEYWLRSGSPWEIARPELSVPVRLYGYVEDRVDEKGRYRPTWTGCKTVIGLPYDILISTRGSRNVNLLRLWSARASDAFDLAAFNRGGYAEAVRERVLSETITKVLYPDDQLDVGKELRLVQQYFFVACSVADILRRFERTHEAIERLPDKVAVQLNDTHPALAIAELMRILLDERALEWDAAWSLTQRIFNYTNHTLLPEALETWRASLFSVVLPRHLQIVYEINRRFLVGVEERWPGDVERLRRMSLVQETPVRAVRMANLAIVGSRRVNGVARLHSDLVKQRLVPDFAALWPDKFTNVTNGVTHRRWLLTCNPDLAQLITSRIGAAWVADLSELRRLEPLAADNEFCAEFAAVKQANKKRLADYVARTLGLKIAPTALFDVQIKRLHEYKRQLLSVLRLIHDYREILAGGGAKRPARVAIFGAKAAPGYRRAKLIIKLIHDVARTINADKRAEGRLRVVFLPNYRVSVAERIVPAADLSEQISLAGTEASGTGNMKLSMNGALTVGTLDGANVEIREAVGAENFFLFGMTTDEVARRRQDYDPWKLYQADEGIRGVLDALAGADFSPDAPGRFRELFDALTAEGDAYMLLADFAAYLDAQRRVDELWLRPRDWTRAAVLNVARMGEFSSDRSVREYAERIWGIAPCPPGSPAETPRAAAGQASAAISPK